MTVRPKRTTGVPKLATAGATAPRALYPTALPVCVFPPLFDCYDAHMGLGCIGDAMGFSVGETQPVVLGFPASVHNPQRTLPNL